MPASRGRINVLQVTCRMALVFSVRRFSSAVASKWGGHYRFATRKPRRLEPKPAWLMQGELREGSLAFCPEPERASSVTDKPSGTRDHKAEAASRAVQRLILSRLRPLVSGLS
jgi:hypothetical protein